MAESHDDVSSNAEQTLLTLEQLSQTLDVMSHVVERLRHHLERQLSLTEELFADEAALLEAELAEEVELSADLEQDSYIVEISQREIEEGGEHILH